MASEAHRRARSLLLDPVWPPDDTEESIVGVDLHQLTILNSRFGINEVAQQEAAAGEPVPWQATDQLLLLGCVRHDGSAYRTMPDVFVFNHPIDRRQGSFSLSEDGAPVLIIEVLSESTYEWDTDLVRGKGYSYAQAGVREYLTLDPTRQWLPEGGRGWRLVDGAYQPWVVDAAGRWHSETIGVGIGLEGSLVTIYTRAGIPVPHEGEMLALLTRKDAEMARKEAEHAAELARRDAELEEMRSQLDQLRGRQ